MKKVDFKNLKNLKGAAVENPLARMENAASAELPASSLSAPVLPGPRTRISVDVDAATLKKLNAITVNRQLASGNIIARASVVRDLLLEAIDQHYPSE